MIPIKDKYIIMFYYQTRQPKLKLQNLCNQNEKFVNV